METEQISPIALAFVGDAVYSLFVRTNLVIASNGEKKDLHARSSRIVNARAQAASLVAIEAELTEEEKDVARRARNAHTHNRAKNASVADYHHSTALEAVFGYLYLKGSTERLEKLMKLSYDCSICIDKNG